MRLSFYLIAISAVTALAQVTPRNSQLAGGGVELTVRNDSAISLTAFAVTCRLTGSDESRQGYGLALRAGIDELRQASPEDSALSMRLDALRGRQLAAAKERDERIGATELKDMRQFLCETSDEVKAANLEFVAAQDEQTMIQAVHRVMAANVGRPRVRANGSVVSSAEMLDRVMKFMTDRRERLVKANAVQLAR